MIPARAAVSLMIIGCLFAWFVGLGASPWFLLVLPVAALGMIGTNS